MKRNTLFALTLLISTYGFAAEVESIRFVDHLLGIAAPAAPELFDDAVIFTAPSSFRRVGIAFEHENFAEIHWFRKLLKAADPNAGEANNGLAAGKASSKTANGPAYTDSGILFHVFQIPRGLGELRYRLIVDGLWTTDPLNPRRRLDPVSGIVHSVLALPPLTTPPSTYEAPAGSLRFSYRGDPGQIVTVGGSFNNWDPFMYELQEESPGSYLLTLPLPPGTYRYVFFAKGERLLDPNNPRKIYTVDGKVASEAQVR